MSWFGTVRRCPGCLRLAALLLAAWPVAVSVRAAAAEPAVYEYNVKAGYLFNFARFVEWPASAFATPTSPFVIGVLDAGEAAPLIKSLLANKQVESRPVIVKAVMASDPGKDLHILFVTRAARTTLKELTPLLAGTPTLLVGETDRFAELGGALEFSREGDSIRLNLNLESAMDAGLKISAKLSNVAKRVKPVRAASPDGASSR